MDITRYKQLAGIPTSYIAEEKELLTELVNRDELVEIDDVIRRLGHCKKALSLANGFTDPGDRKKWKSLAMSNLNVIRAAMTRIVKELSTEFH